MSFQMTEEDLNFTDNLVFKNGEIVKMQIADVRENVASGDIVLKVAVLSGSHTGKQTDVFISGRDNAAAKKRKGQFAHCFMKSGVWKRDELIAGNADLKLLLGHLITAKSSVRDGTDGKIFQNWDELQDNGLPNGAVLGNPVQPIVTAANTSF